MTTVIEQLYTAHIRRLSQEEQLRLVALITNTLAEHEPHGATPKHSIMELHGLGKEIWQGVDAQAYVNQLRDEWDHHS